MLRKGVELILRRDLSRIHNQGVLEIGCGSNDYAKRILQANGNSWFGLDMVEGIAPLKGSVKSLPFFNNMFDVVLCTQCFEHLYEYGCSFEKALNEIHRVLKHGGWLLINVCMQNHGHPYFLCNKLNEIKQLFKKEDWGIELFEKVIPKERVEGWKRLSNKGGLSHVGFPNFLIKDKKLGSYILNIHVRKRYWPKREQEQAKSRSIVDIALRFAKEWVMS